MKSLALAATLTAATPALAETGLFLAWPAQPASPVHQWEETAAAALQDAACRLHRSGTLSASLGPLDWPQMEGFRLYRCARPVLASLAASGATAALAHHGRLPVMVEGSLTLLPADAPEAEAEYIVKLSHYNNLDVPRRTDDLTALGSAIAELENVWQTEAVLTPEKAVGTLRPDDITFLYYGTDAEAEAFRTGNPGVLEQVGRFNKAHLTAFTYLGATVLSQPVN
ncbi:hypothetical protein K3725_10885 [Leisingera sp. S132]|uniref:hypothetical protein n=1 Tax=Leisingera sp. S132 TaxID=2867016 RepID=UPI0021A524B7|nr:hypothetical protein [Leisingera sp. S132]UWQ77826.1 hypothetical protein K3725_10885 [Leisingera sp. S132]